MLMFVNQVEQNLKLKRIANLPISLYFGDLDLNFCM